MKLLIQLYRRLEDLQRTLAFRIVASVIVVAVCAGFFGFLIVRSTSIASQRQALFAALDGQNLKNGDEHAVSLNTAGEINLNGRHYGGPRFLKPRQPWFDADGNIADMPLLLDLLLTEQVPDWAPDWLIVQPGTTWMLGAVTLAWLLLVVWMQLALPLALTLAGTAIPVWVCWMTGRQQGMLAFAGIGLLTFTFVLLTRVLSILLDRPWQAFAVAHTVLKEASRTRVALVFIVVLLVTLPVLPLTLDPASPLRYRLQTFISLSMGITFLVAACMTLFLSCASVAFEIRDRQIWQLMTKPLGRLQYLLGKWIGVALVNLVILTVSGVSIFTYIQYLRTTSPAGDEETRFLDALAVRDEVLTARIGEPPAYKGLEPEQLRTRVNQIIEADPQYSEMEKVPLYTRMKIENDQKVAYSSSQRLIPAGAEREFTFTGLKEAKRLNSSLTLRYRFHILGDDEHLTFKARFIFNKNPAWRWDATYVPAISHSIPIPADYVNDDGELIVTIQNLYRQTSEQRGLGPIVGGINWEEADFELLYKVGSFEANFCRAMLLTWVKLVFLAALGVGCSTFLSFPVACLLSFTVFLAGMIGPFLAEALKWYYPPEGNQMDWGNAMLVVVWLFETCIRAVAQAVVFLLASFGEYDPGDDLVQGRLIPWRGVVSGVLKLGLLWSGLAMIIGFLVLRKRELATYSGQG